MRALRSFGRLYPSCFVVAETKRFYKALNTIGTDFSLMQKYFPIRTRLELKNKFKREEKLNRNLIDTALNNPSEFDITQFEKYLGMY